MSPRQLLALDSLNKGLRAKDTHAACYVAFIGAVFRLDGEHGSLRYPLAYTQEQYADSGNCFSIYRAVAIRGDFPARKRGALIREEGRSMRDSIVSYYDAEFIVRWIKPIVLKRSVYAWGPGASTRRSWATLLENLRWLRNPARGNEVMTLDPRVVSYGWYLMDEMPTLVK